jgi:dienelactone hydrolase
MIAVIDLPDGALAMRVIRVVAALAALLLSVASAAALESAMAVPSPLSADELWKKIGDLCGITVWDPAVDTCVLSADGRQRMVHIYGRAGTVVSELESWDDVNRSFSFRGISGLLPVSNYRATVSVTVDGTGSVLKMTATYDADGVADADAKKAIDRRMYTALCLGGPLLCTRDQRPASAAEIVEFASTRVVGKPVMLKGYLRHPSGAGPFPAVVLLHGCNGFPESLDLNWGVKLAAWGYATLTVDSFLPRGLKNACGGGLPMGVSFDAYQALDFLGQQPFVDAGRVAVLGFSQGGFLSLSAVENGPIERATKRKFRAAVAFYPLCVGIKGPTTVPSLILIGEKDDWTPADACRKLANGEDDLGVSRSKGEGAALQLKVFPGAYHAFDVPSLEKPVSYFGHHLEYNKTAADEASEMLREFLASDVGERR